MIVLGLTGQSGAGKSYVCDILRGAGIPCLDTDRVARYVCEAGTPCLAELHEAFGDGILLPDGSLDRKALGKIVFSDREKLQLLNNITHKYIRAETEEWLNTYRCAGAALAVVDAPVLFESGFDALCDCTAAVIAPEEIRLARILRRDGITEEAARARLASQHDDGFFETRCDYIIRNGHTDPTAAVLETVRDIRSRYDRA